MQFIIDHGHDGENGPAETAACGCHASRRGFLTGLASLGICAAAPGWAAAAVSAKPRRIDVHHHLLPPSMAALVKAKNLMQSNWNNWSPQKGLDDMDQGGVDLAILSIATPGIWFGDAADAARIARECNDYAARVVADHPGRFGMFATLPLPDIDGSLKEIAYALDTLKADGVAMFTSYGDKWLGDPALAPVFEELDRRKAVIYTHPNNPACCRNLVPGQPPPMIELGTDTTRAIARMIFSGASRRYPDVKMIFSHAGGTMPFLIERFWFEARLREKAQTMVKGQVDDVKKFYYDTAQTSNPASMAALRRSYPCRRSSLGPISRSATRRSMWKGSSTVALSPPRNCWRSIATTPCDCSIAPRHNQDGAVRIGPPPPSRLGPRTRFILEESAFEAYILFGRLSLGVSPTAPQVHHWTSPITEFDALHVWCGATPALEDLYVHWHGEMVQYYQGIWLH